MPLWILYNIFDCFISYGPAQLHYIIVEPDNLFLQPHFLQVRRTYNQEVTRSIPSRRAAVQRLWASCSHPSTTVTKQRNLVPVRSGDALRLGRSVVAMATRHKLQWFIHLPAHDLRKREEHLANTPHGVRHTTYLPLDVTPASPLSPWSWRDGRWAPRHHPTRRTAHNLSTSRRDACQSTLPVVMAGREMGTPPSPHTAYGTQPIYL